MRGRRRSSPAADWLATRVVVPASARPDVRGAPPGDRAARAGPAARPRADARGARGGRAAPDDLTVIVGAGEIEAAVRPDGAPMPARDALERARLERELAEAEGWLAAARERLANEAFMAKAPPARRRGRAGARGRARRPGRPAPGRPRTLTDGTTARVSPRPRRPRTWRPPAGGPRHRPPPVDDAARGRSQPARQQVVDPVRAARAPGADRRPRRRPPRTHRRSRRQRPHARAPRSGR